MSGQPDGARRWRPVDYYVGVISALGLFVLVAHMSAIDPGAFAGPRPKLFWLLAALLLIGELRPFKRLRREQGGEVTASWTFSVALLLSAPAGSALAASALASVVGDFAQRKPLKRALFNVAQVTLSLAAGGWVLGHFASGYPLLHSDSSLRALLPAVVLAAVVIYIVNSVLTSTVLALHQEVAVAPRWRSGLLASVSTDGMLFALAPVMVVLGQRSLLLLPFVLVTGWAVYRSATLAQERQHEATHDQLTELPNRRLFLDETLLALSEARRKEQPLAVVVVDLDGFKGINDRLGHAVGDSVLQEVARRFQAVKRSTDIVARLGGDEFALLLRGVPDTTSASAVAGRLLRTLEAPYLPHGFPVAVSGSFGIALYPHHGDDVESLLRHADVAMYTAKQERSGIHIYSDDSASAAHGRLDLLAELAQAIAGEELLLHYQPKVSFADKRVVGVEALVRWQHPTLGLVPPGEFVALAEHTELMGQFTEYVLRQALRQCADWHREGIYLGVAVNGSARNLHDRRFPDMVARLLEETGVEARWLELEITENTVMADPQRTTTVLKQLRSMGVAVAIDDFGTGYSSLANLRNLSVDWIKIDRSFVSDMASSPDDAMIVRSLLELAANLGLGTVAEGIEDDETYRMLERMGCDVAQGFLFSRPLPPAELTAWLGRLSADPVAGVALAGAAG